MMERGDYGQLRDLSQTDQDGDAKFCDVLLKFGTFLCATMYEYNTSMKSDVHDLL